MSVQYGGLAVNKVVTSVQQTHYVSIGARLNNGCRYKATVNERRAVHRPCLLHRPDGHVILLARQTTTEPYWIINENEISTSSACGNSSTRLH